jgi:hypothetical protein
VCAECIQFAHKKLFFGRFGEGKVCTQEIRERRARESEKMGGEIKQGQTGKESNEGARTEDIFP